MPGDTKTTTGSTARVPSETNMKIMCITVCFDRNSLQFESYKSTLEVEDRIWRMQSRFLLKKPIMCLATLGGVQNQSVAIQPAIQPWKTDPIGSTAKCVKIFSICFAYFFGIRNCKDESTSREFVCFLLLLHSVFRTLEVAPIMAVFPRRWKVEVPVLQQIHLLVLQTWNQTWSFNATCVLDVEAWIATGNKLSNWKNPGWFS